MKKETIKKIEATHDKDAQFSMHESADVRGRDYRQSWRIFRIMAELVEGYELMGEYDNEVTIFGSARTKEENKFYKIAVELGETLVDAGHEVITGGGPGIMEAANRGAHNKGGVSIGLNIQLPFEQRVNPYVNKAAGFYYFFTRKVVLATPANAFVFFPGGFGTLDEFFEVVDHIELGKMCAVPIVLVGSEFWGPLIEFLRTTGETNGTVTEDQIAKWHIVDSAAEAMEYIQGGKGMKATCELSSSNFNNKANQDWRVFRVMSELVDGFEFLTGLGEDVSVLGTKSISVDSPYYTAAYELGKTLAQKDFATITGGAPGIAEAANKGAFEHGGTSIGIGMEVHGKARMNQYVTRSLMFSFPFTRKLMLTAPSRAFVFFPGGLGTFHQLFEVMTLIQTKKIARIPILLYDTAFWGPLDAWIRATLADEFGTISSEDTDIYQIVDTIPDALDIIEASDVLTTDLD